MEPLRIEVCNALTADTLAQFQEDLQRHPETPLTCILLDAGCDDGLFRQHLDILLQQSHRWKDIAISSLGFDGHAAQMPLITSPRSFPLLENIEIDLPSDSTCCLLPVLENSSKLIDMSIRTIYPLQYLVRPSQFIRLKLSKTVTELGSDAVRHEPQLLTLLAQCTNLQSLRISSVMRSPRSLGSREIVPPPTITLPELRLFSFAMTDIYFPSTWLRSLSFPNLLALEISPGPLQRTSLTTSGRGDLLDFTSRHGHTVRRLTLGSPSSSSEDWRWDVLEQMPIITSLDLAESGIRSVVPAQSFEEGRPTLAYTRWDGDRDNREYWTRRALNRLPDAAVAPINGESQPEQQLWGGLPKPSNSKLFVTLVEERWRGIPSSTNGFRTVPVDDRLRILRMGVDTYASLQKIDQDAMARLQRCVEEGLVLEPCQMPPLGQLKVCVSICKGCYAGSKAFSDCLLDKTLYRSEGQNFWHVLVCIRELSPSHHIDIYSSSLLQSQMATYSSHTISSA